MSFRKCSWRYAEWQPVSQRMPPCSGAMVQFGAPISSGLSLTETLKYEGSNSPESTMALACITGGRKSWLWDMDSLTLCFEASWIILSHSAVLRAIGFSNRMFFPSFAASQAISAWVDVGVHILIKSRFFISKSSV